MEKRVAASILLVLSLDALLVAAAAAAGATGDTDIIRLPSDAAKGFGGQAVATAKKGNDENKPWKCCDSPVNVRLFPPLWFCGDHLERCDCKSCEEVKGSPSYYYCADFYQGDFPGPKCTDA